MPGMTVRFRTLVIGGAALALSGCAVPDYLNPLTLFEDDVAATETEGAAAVRSRADEAEQAAQDGDFPRLSSVPERPTGLSTPGLRQRVVEGLIADRANARYTDDAPSVIRPASGPASSDETSQVPDVSSAGDEVAAAAAAEARTGAVRRPPVPPRPGTSSGELMPSAGDDVNVRPAGGPTPRQLPVAAAPQAQTASLAPSAVGVAEPLAVIQFANGSNNLDTRDIDILRQVAQISGQTGAAVRVVGHASGGGNAIANQDVSMARARAVAQALVALGVAPQLVSFEGRADLAPLYDEQTSSGAAGNRRAEIYLNL